MQVATTQPPPIPAPGPALTWFRLHAGTTVLDFPLRLTHTSSQAWAATIWPDPRSPHGWHLEPWKPGPHGRGFIPTGIELGDIVEFGVNHTTHAREPRHAEPQLQRWHGYLHAIRPDAVIIHGPYPTPHAAYAAAQHALVTQIASTTVTTGSDSLRREPHPTRTTHLSGPAARHGMETTTPAQPPAAVSITFTGDQATVGDPVHGWIVVDAARLLAAATHPPERLHQLLQHHAPRTPATITGREARLTLAALAAHHLPGDIPPAPAAAPPPDPNPTGPDPTAPSPDPTPHADPTATAAGADPTGPDPTGPDPTGPDPTGPDPRGPDPRGSEPTGPDAATSTHPAPPADPPTASL